jgi:tRNA 5-methylaminomethyl-2-thiouridine biosynthesis bifunctional protein
MKTAPIREARLAFNEDTPPRAGGDEDRSRHPSRDLVLHPDLALAQARHVFLQGHGLPGRWAGRERFVVLDTGFGLGHRFLATWDAWRQDPHRCERLHVVAIEQHPPSAGDLARAHQQGPLPGLARALCDAWPLATPNLHACAFEQGRVQLLLAYGDLATVLPELMASVDAFFLDGFTPPHHPAAQDDALWTRLPRLAAPGATAATASAEDRVRQGLARAGFEVQAAPSIDGNQAMTVARYAPRHTAPVPAGGLRSVAAGTAREALIVGGGLAGCAAAWALGEQGWHSTVLDRAAAPASAASGNPAGLFHGSFHADDGLHARLLRAASLATQALAGGWIAEGRVTGACDGFLRLDPRLDEAQAHAALAAQALPRAYLGWWDRDEARARTGLALPSGGWAYPGGGWLAPATYAQALLDASGAAWRGPSVVARIERRDGRWQAFDAAGGLLGEAPVLVLANARAAVGLLPATTGMGPLAAVRGQLSWLPADTPGLPSARLPVAGHGYLLPPHEGRVIFGATSQHGDTEPTLRDADHRSNLAQLQGLCGWPAEAIEADLATLANRDAAQGALGGRVGWRAVTPDRLPLIGALPDLEGLTALRRRDQPRLVPRLRDAQGGLYVFTGLGSRGITWAALGARVLASWVTGAPCPIESDLRDALDPARAALRSPRSASSSTTPSR